MKEFETMAEETPSQDDLLAAWAAIYQAALDDEGLETAIGAHSRLLGYTSESQMRQNRERILGTIEKVRNTTGLESALRRALGGV